MTLAEGLRRHEDGVVRCFWATDDVLYRRYHDDEWGVPVHDDVRLFEGAPVFFQCTCSRERVEGILRSLGHEEVGDIIQERGSVEVRCEFCNRAYQYDAVDAATLFAVTVTPASREVH